VKKLRVTVDGKVYEVLVEILDEPQTHEPRRAAWATTVSPARITPSPPAGSAAHAAAKPGEVPSPLAGKVVSIDVRPGQQVGANQQLLTLEAMKMNTYVFSPHAGTVATILVYPGDAVEEGQGLVCLA